MIKPSGAMKGNLYTLLLCILVFLPVLALAQTIDDAVTPFRALTGIPGVTDGGQMPDTFGGYINALYALSIGLAGMLVVIKLIYAGTKYMLSGVVTDKEDAKKDIRWALIGLLIILGAVIILTTINTDLTEVDTTLQPIETTNTTNSLRRQLEGVQSIEERCAAEDTDCKITVGGNKEQCELRDGIFHQGSWAGLAPGINVNVRNRCVTMTTAVCNAGEEKILGNQGYRCVDTDFEIAAYENEEFMGSRVTELQEEGFEIVRNGHSDFFDARDQRAKGTAISECLEQSGTEYEFIKHPNQDNVVSLYCLKRP